MVPNVKCAPLDQVLDNYNAIRTLIIISAAVTLISGAAATLPSLVGGGPAVVVPAATAVIAGCLAAIASIMWFRNYEFNNKLACIDGVRCAMGQVIGLEHCGDGDDALNLLLAPVYAPSLDPGAAIDVGGHTLQLRLQVQVTLADYKTYVQPADLVFDPGGLADAGLGERSVRQRHDPIGCGWIADVPL